MDAGRTKVKVNGSRMLRKNKGPKLVQVSVVSLHSHKPRGGDCITFYRTRDCLPAAEHRRPLDNFIPQSQR